MLQLRIILSENYYFSRLGYFFWTDFFEDDIKRANFDGSNITTIINTGLDAPGKESSFGVNV